MKNILCVFLMFLIMLLCGCNTKLKMPKDEQLTGESQTFEDFQNQSVILPSVNVFSANWDNIFQKAVQEEISGFVIMEKIGNYYLGSKLENNLERQEIDETEILIEIGSNKEIPLTYPTNFPNWNVGSGSYVVLNDQYLYQWRSYTSQFADGTEHDMKLTCLDVKSGKVSIVDEMKLSTPLVYLCQIDNEHFLSYYIIKTDSDKVEYATLTIAEIYDINGTKKEVIHTKYENDVSWTDSEGTLIEDFATKDGEIYGFGRRRISNEYKFFLYHYDKDGKLLEIEELPGFENIIGDEQPVEFLLVGDYIIFRTYESLTAYICKRTENGIELIMKGMDGKTSYAISTNDTKIQKTNYIFFIENNVNDDDTIKEKECPLYAIEVVSGKIKAVNFPVPLRNPYFGGLKALSNGDLLATYCEGEYDPMSQKQFLLQSEKMHVLFDTQR